MIMGSEKLTEGSIWYSVCSGKAPMARRVQELRTQVLYFTGIRTTTGIRITFLGYVQEKKSVLMGPQNIF